VFLWPSPEAHGRTARKALEHIAKHAMNKKLAYENILGRS